MRPSTPWTRCAALLALTLVLAACATVPAGVTAGAGAVVAADAPFADDRFGPPSVPADASRLFELDDAMRRYVQRDMAQLLRSEGRQQGLVDALYRREALQLVYDPTLTRSASETFAARRGNCLSLVIMTAAFAKHLGLRVDYRAALIDDHWSRRGSLAVASGHVNITLGQPLAERNRHPVGGSSRLTVDFLPPDDLKGLRTRPIDETVLVAMYLNNRAAEALASGALDDAYAWASAAARQAPEFASAWNTLGAIYRRHGDLALAIRAFRAALARDPQRMSAMANLVQVLAADGQAAEAAAWQQRLAALEAHPPFEDLLQGWRALDRGDWLGAQRAFVREMRRSGPAPDLHHGLAIAAHRLGDLAEARRQLADAARLSTGGDDEGRYLAKLERLGAAASRLQ